MQKTKILLASISFSAYEWLPYPVGCLISHCKKDAKINEMYEFMEPEYRSQSLDKDDFHENFFSSISDLVPQLIKDTFLSMHENVKEAVTNSLPSYRDIVGRNKKSLSSN